MGLIRAVLVLDSRDDHCSDQGYQDGGEDTNEYRSCPRHPKGQRRNHKNQTENGQKNVRSRPHGYRPVDAVNTDHEDMAYPQ